MEASGAGVEPAAFRDAISRLPAGVAVVTTLDAHGQPRGFTCTALCAVSLRPPLLLCCVHQSSRTLSAVRGAGAFGVNLLHADWREVADLFASLVPDKFAHVQWQPGPGLGLPWLTAAADALFECSLVREHPAGDHSILIGLVSAVSLADSGTSLIYCRRSYATWAVAEEAIARPS